MNANVLRMLLATLMIACTGHAAEPGIQGMFCMDDNDGDGFIDAGCGGDDCDDFNPSVNPGMIEVCGDGIDNNCDGFGGSFFDDEDFDGCASGIEMNLNVDACDADTDDDGLDDNIEMGGDCTIDPGETDPRDADTDDDAVGDGVESATADQDMDGLADAVDPDRDNDQLIDGLEAGLLTGISGGVSDGLGYSYDGTTGFAGDADPLTTTDPDNVDTDGDGVIDGAEDRNQDGAVSPGESDPLDSDSDDDGLPDGVEDADANGVQDPGESSAIDPDSDDDLVCDGTRADNDSDGLDPSDPCTGAESALGTHRMDADSDDDALSDGDEPLLGTSPVLSDSDGDLLNDGQELGLTNGIPAKGNVSGTALSWMPDTDPNTTTDPLNDDTDGDLLADGDEDADHDGAVDGNETDPNMADTDQDGVDDYQEIICGTDPLNPMSVNGCFLFSDGFENS